MKTLSCLIAALFFASASGAESIPVVASVMRVREEEPPLKPGVYVDFVVHAPGEYRGLPITMFAAGASRRARRAQFPLGAQFRLRLPDAAIAALKKAKIDEEHIQGLIGDGVKLEMISQLVIPAQLDLTELATKPAIIDVQ